jgi:hypothetical protein
MAEQQEVTFVIHCGEALLLVTQLLNCFGTGGFLEMHKDAPLSPNVMVEWLNPPASYSRGIGF